MTKIDIISGFLGAGKTTFIKKMLEEVFTGEKIVLIENEFGEIGIDGGFLKDSGIEISEMNSGCICCSLVGDFGRNLREVLERFSPDRILIEPSGVGKLSDVMKSVKDVEAEQEVVLSGLVTVVNTLKATKQMRAFGEFFNNQIEYASIIVLSRTQKASLGQLEEVVKAIREKNPKAAILTTPWEELEGKQIYKLMEQQKSLEEELMEAQKNHAHGHGPDCSCGCHDHEHHHHEHGHHDHEHEECHHDHEHEHDHHSHGQEDHHDHDHHEHHDYDHEECHHDHEHEHGHHEHGHHSHGQEDHHDHDHHEHHDHGHDHEGHDHHDHGPDCTCGCHDHDHHHHHHADEVFTSWGVETPHQFTRDVIDTAMKAFCDTEDYGVILRAKGMVPSEEGTWIYFDMVDGEYELREGEPDYTGRLCVIGTDLKEEKLTELFGIA
ncbi:MAG: GTP-binding protein [Lachnospiraceae bacterium]|jgi:G3E family GTPase|nr:GTP-binding protein [Lachnospiraceae bacterium]